MKAKIIIAICTRLLFIICAALVGCGEDKPARTFAFTGYQDGHMVFETVDGTYLVTCEGSGKPPYTDAHAVQECRAILPFRGHILPPTYVVGATGDGDVFISIPSLDLTFYIDDVY